MAKKANPFRTLQDFANTKDQADAATFCENHPGFLPCDASSAIEFRSRLRDAWNRLDSGHNLGLLLGIDRECSETAAALPEAHPKVDPVSGHIEWEFGSEFQRRLYALFCTSERWRVMTCTVCGKFFTASKSAQKHCSSKCYFEFKRQRSLEYWNRSGKKIRKRKAAAQRRTHGKK